MQEATFYISDQISGLEVAITITDDGSGTLTFELNVLTETGVIGDLNAIYFDFANDTITDSIAVTGDDVTGTAFEVDGVTKVSNFTNMNGEVVKDLGRFDAGIQFGTQGISGDDIQSTTFTLTSTDPDYTLSLQDFSLQDFGLRLTSVGLIDSSRDDSLKLGETAPEFPDAPPPPPPGPVCDDFLFVTEDEGFAPPAPPGVPQDYDTLESGAASILANDIGATAVASVNGVNLMGDDFQMIQGTNGGYLMINSAGIVDFSTSFDGVNDFADLNQGESRETSFVYTTDNGLEKILCVTVDGIGDGGGTGSV